MGSNIAISLLRAGLGCLVIADFDVVSPNNLNRQQYFADQIGLPKVEALHTNLSRISPYTRLEMHNLRVTPDNLAELFGSCQILIEAFDRAEEKEMLLSTWQDLYPHRHCIGASGLAGIGRNELIKCQSFGYLHIVGDGCSELTPPVSPVSARVAVVAAMQANLALELIFKDSQ